MKKLLIPLLILTCIASLSACNSGPSKQELQSEIEYLREENENLKYECNVLIAERDYAVASAYFLNDILEKRNGSEYLDEIFIEADSTELSNFSDNISVDMNYYYIDYLTDFCTEYAMQSVFYELADDADLDIDTFKSTLHFGNFQEMLRTVEESGQQNYDISDLK